MSPPPIVCPTIAVHLIRGRGPSARLLLMKRVGGSLDGLWCQVSGKIESGERAWQAALREVREETGLTPAKFYSADLCEQFYEPGRECVTIAPVFVGYVPDDAVVELNDEHSEFGWLELDEALSKLEFLGQRRIVRTIWQEFVEGEVPKRIRIDVPKA